MARNHRDEQKEALVFTHAMAMQGSLLLAEARVETLALAYELVETGVVDLDAMEARTARIRASDERDERRRPHVQLHDVEDKYSLTDLPDIDCAARLPLCGARCCSFTFPLSVQDVREGVIEWDASRPYQIKQRPDGFCAHNCPQTRSCLEHTQRPAVCRTYDCRRDVRVWIDFERRIPAPLDPRALGPDGGYRGLHGHQP